VTKKVVSVFVRFFAIGDVFINLDKQATVNSLRNLGLSGWHEDLDQLTFNLKPVKYPEKHL
jgi:putative hydrolase of the HAD superfamily